MPFTVTIKNTGQKFVVPDSKSILEAAADEGIDLDYGCESGVCSACRVKLVSGKVDDSEGDALTSEEKTEGWVLTCVGHPKSDVVIELV